MPLLFYVRNHWFSAFDYISHHLWYPIHFISCQVKYYISYMPKIWHSILEATIIHRENHSYSQPKQHDNGVYISTSQAMAAQNNSIKKNDVTTGNPFQANTPPEAHLESKLSNSKSNFNNHMLQNRNDRWSCSPNPTPWTNWKEINATCCAIMF